MKKCLLIGEPEQPLFLEKLQRALPKDSILEEARANALPNKQYDLYIIDSVDAEDIQDILKIAHNIRKINPHAIILIAGLSLTWSRVRDAFKAGIKDYFSKAISEEQLRQIVNTTCNKGKRHG